MLENKNIDSTAIQLVRYGDLVPCRNAFIDTRTPGSDKKENFTIIGPGVSENPDQYVHIAQPHGFNIGGARQPPHCVNSQHSHETEEVFFVHSGVWSFNLGEHATDARITLHRGDLISIPTHLFRGFENIGDDVGFLWAILGGDDPGRVLWAPNVFDMAKDYGLILLENGNLVDTNNGEAIPDGSKPMPRTTAAQVAELQRFNNEQLRACCAFASKDRAPNGKSNRKLIGRNGILAWPHCFEVEEDTLPAGGHLESYPCATAEVIFVHQGSLTIEADSEQVTAHSGDTATIARGAVRGYANPSAQEVTFLRVRNAPIDNRKG